MLTETPDASRLPDAEISVDYVAAVQQVAPVSRASALATYDLDTKVVPLADSPSAASAESDAPLHANGPRLLSKGMVKLYIMWLIPFQATFVAGYAVGGMTAINAMSQFQDYCLDWRSALITLGTCLVAFAQNMGMLLSGRILLGAGVGMIQTVLGNALATAVSVGAISISSPWAWRIPVSLQLASSCVYLYLFRAV
ncbi:hypothetical protein Q5752_001440 [Cryptotrichosporon argae]